jgi:hypothetical protein
MNGVVSGAGAAERVIAGEVFRARFEVEMGNGELERLVSHRACTLSRERGDAGEKGPGDNSN